MKHQTAYRKLRRHERPRSMGAGRYLLPANEDDWNNLADRRVKLRDAKGDSRPVAVEALRWFRERYGVRFPLLESRWGLFEGWE